MKYCDMTSSQLSPRAWETRLLRGSDAAAEVKGVWMAVAGATGCEWGTHRFWPEFPPRLSMWPQASHSPSRLGFSIW